MAEDTTAWNTPAPEHHRFEVAHAERRVKAASMLDTHDAACRLRAVLRDGCRRFSMDAGFVLRAETGTRALELDASWPDAHQLSALEQSLSRDALLQNACIYVDSLAAVEGGPRPIDSFFGMPVTVAESSKAVLGFSRFRGSRSPIGWAWRWRTRAADVRSQRMGTSDREVLRLMAQWTAAELEKVDLERQLERHRSLAVIGSTAATFAHEVSNPLGNMGMACEVVHHRIAAGRVAEAQAGIDLLHREIGRLQKLLEEFRALSPGVSLRLSSIGMHDLVIEVLEEFMPVLRAHSIHLHKSIYPVVPIVIDRDRMKQVIVNLVKNAIEAMSRGGTLAATVHFDGTDVIVKIADSGIGIREGLDVFAPFVSTKQTGSGLGLSVVRTIVAAHGGKVRFDTVPGQGTTFVVSVPRRAPMAGNSTLVGGVDLG